MERRLDVEVKSISKNRAWLYIREALLVLSIDRLNESCRLVLWKGGTPTKVVEFKNITDLMENVVFDDPALEVTVKEIVKQLIENWEYYHLKFVYGDVAKLVESGYSGSEPRASSTDELAKFAASLVKENFKVVELVVEGVPTGLLYCREGVVWRPCRPKIESFIGSLGEIQTAIGKKISKEFVERVLYNVGLTSRKDVKYGNYIAFGNKVLDLEKFIETGNIYSSFIDPEYVDVYYIIDHELDLNALVRAEGIKAYIPPSDCNDLLAVFSSIAPETYGYFKQLVRDSSADKPITNSKICFLAQLIGRMFYPGYVHQGAVARQLKNLFALIGPPNTGKSTFIVNYVGESVLGKDNFKVGNISRLTSIDPEDRLRELGDLFNVLMVVFPDIGSDTRVNDWSAITGITGGDPVKARRLRKDAFEYYPAYKIVFTTNSPPPLPREKEIKLALIERMRILEMSNRFVSVLDIKPLVEEIPRSIIVYLYALRLIFTKNWADTGVSNIEDLWLRYQEPLYKFIIEMIENGLLIKCQGCEVSTGDLYSFIQDYISKKTLCEDECEEEEPVLFLPRQEQFTKQLKTWAPLLGLKIVKKKGYTYVKGLTIRIEQKSLVGSTA